MKVRRGLAALLAVVTTLSFALAGCGTAKQGDNTANSQPQKITINLGNEPPEMNSILTTDVVSMNVLRHVEEGLTILDQNSKPVAGIAKSWTTSTDGLEWTFTLRDAKWSDGSPVSAQDFEFAFKTVLNPESAAEYAYIMYCFKNGEAYNTGKATADDVGVKAIDDKTLKITLERPTPYLLDLLAFGVFMPVKEDFYNANKDTYGTDADKMLYNGPWIMKSWAHQDSIVLEKNPNYYDKSKINLDEITMLMVKDANTGLNMFLGDEADMVGIRADQIDKAKQEGYTSSNYSDGATAYFEFNLKDSVVGNQNIRKALSYAIDRGSFVKNILQGTSLPALSFTNPVIQGKDTGSSFKSEVGDLIMDNNSDEAKALLAQGMQELGLTDKPKITLTTDDTDVAKRDAAFYQESWKKNLDLDVEVQTLPFETRLDKQTSKDFQICLALWGPDYNDPMTFLDMFETGNGNNHTSFSNADYDALLAKIRNENDRATRFSELEQTEKLLMDQMPIAPVYFRSRDYLVKPYLKGVVRDAFQDINLRWASVDKK